MTILGSVVDLCQTRNYRRFSLSSRNVTEWEDRAAEITSQLEAYGQSLKEFEAHHFTNAHESSGQPAAPNATAMSRLTDSMVQTKHVVAYGTHIMHVLHILVTDKWDPINLLDDNDLWISAPSFRTAMSHAVVVAEPISNIQALVLRHKLVARWVLFLLTAEKLAGEADPNVVGVCENIIKAHEACIVTLNTEYQVCLPILCFVLRVDHENHWS